MVTINRRLATADVLSVLRALCGIVLVLVMLLSAISGWKVKVLALVIVGVAVASGVVQKRFFNDDVRHQWIATAADFVFLYFAVIGYFFSFGPWADKVGVPLVLFVVSLPFGLFGGRIKVIDYIARVLVLASLLCCAAALPLYAELVFRTHSWLAHSIGALPAAIYYMIVGKRFWQLPAD